MIFSYRLSDIIITIKQNQLQRKTVMSYTLCNSILHILNILYKNGYIYSYFVDNNIKKVFIYLKYNKNMQPVIHQCKILSRPSRRFYITFQQLNKLVNNNSLYGLFILHTTKGLITHYDALFYKIGGELIIYLY